MTCDVDHKMVKSKALSNPSNPKYLWESRRLLKPIKTYSCKLDLKKKKKKAHAREWHRLVDQSLFTHQILHHRQPKLQNRYFHKKTRIGFWLERFSNIII